MNSSDVCAVLRLPTGKWTKLDRVIAPDSTGVYFIRTANEKPVGRLRGTSDLIYIGQGNLRDRLKAHANFSTDFGDKGWLLGLIADATGGGLEVAFAQPLDPPPLAENTLLVQYFTEHLELPPANSSFGTLTDSQQSDLEILRFFPQSASEQRKSFKIAALRQLWKRTASWWK